MESLIKEISADIDNELTLVKTKDEFEKVRIKYIGRKGKISDLLKKIATLPVEERKDAGQLINCLKNDASCKFNEKSESLLGSEPNEEAGEAFDTRCVLKQVANRHFVPLGWVIRQKPRQGIVERQFAVFDQQQNRSCRELLGYRADPVHGLGTGRRIQFEVR